MGQTTGISWATGGTFNPWRGCTKVSEGCKFCYADRMSKRNPKVLGEWGPGGTRVLASTAMWHEPLKWNKEAEKAVTRNLVFCASLADIFEDWPGQMNDHKGQKLWFYPPTRGILRTEQYSPCPEGCRSYTLDDARAELWDLIRATPNLIWLLLTKRPDNIGRMMPHGDWSNVWLGASVESQDYTPRLDMLLEAPQKVPVRFCSYEPAIGPLKLDGVLSKSGINWMIVGGESGSEARPFHLGWARDMINQCRDAKVPCFFKQTGSSPMDMEGFDDVLAPNSNFTGKGDDPEEWPTWMQVREFPAAT